VGRTLHKPVSNECRSEMIASGAASEACARSGSYVVVTRPLSNKVMTCVALNWHATHHTTHDTHGLESIHVHPKNRRQTNYQDPGNLTVRL
jgi:hypothetical protein